MTSSHSGSSSIIPSGLAAADAESASSNAAQSSWPDDRAFNSSIQSGELTVCEAAALCPSWEVIVVHARCIIVALVDIVVFFCESLESLGSSAVTRSCMAPSTSADATCRMAAPFTGPAAAVPESGSGRGALDRRPFPRVSPSGFYLRASRSCSQTRSLTSRLLPPNSTSSTVSRFCATASYCFLRFSILRSCL